MRRHRFLLAALLALALVALWLRGGESPKGSVDAPRTMPTEGAEAELESPTPGPTGRSNAEAEDRAVQQRAVQESLDRPSSTEVEAAPEGFELWFQVNDFDGTPLENASVSICWPDSVEKRTATPRREDLLVYLGGVPGGPAFVEARAPGFATHRYATFVPLIPPRIEEFFLHPAGRVSGEVLLDDGTPPGGQVEILYWEERAEIDAISAIVEDAGPSHRFVLDDAPTGLVHLVALSPQFGVGQTKSIDVRPGDDRRVVLEIPRRSVAVTCRVLDELTGRPIVGARASATLPLGVPRSAARIPLSASTSDDTGHIQLELTAIESQRLQLTAEHHSSRLVDLPAGQADIDLGDIILGPTRPLTFCIVSPGALRGPDYQLSSDDALFPKKAFGSDGCAVVSDFPNSDVDFTVQSPDGNFIFGSAHIPSDRRIEVPIDGPHSVLVSFQIAAPPAPEEQLVLAVGHNSAPGVELRRTFLLDDLAPIRVEGISRTPVTAILSIAAGPLIATATGQIPEGEGELRLTIRSEGRTKTFHVVDAHGEPLIEAKVYLAKLGGEAMGVTDFTDLDGSCTLVLPEGEIFGIVSHRNGKRAGIRVEEGDEPQLIEIDASGSITMLVELDGLPFPGAICAIGDPQVRRLIGDPAEADTEGRITWSGLHPGRYFVDVTHPALERLQQELNVGLGEAVDFLARMKRK